MQGGMTLLTFDDMEMLKYRIHLITDTLQDDSCSKESRIKWAIDEALDLIVDLEHDTIVRRKN